MRRLILGAIALSVSALVLSSAPAQAQSLTVDVSRFGIYEDFGVFSHSPNTGSLQRIDVGQTAPGVIARNYLVFNLSGLDFTATTATLRIFSNSNPQLDPADQTNDLGIFALSTPLTTVTDSPEGAPADPGDQALYGSIFADLGDGTSYGTKTLVAADITPGSFIDIPITAALADINAAAGSSFGVGGSLLNIGDVNQALYFSGGVFSPTAQLLITGNGSSTAAPEPSSAALALGLIPIAGVLARRIRRRA